MKRRPGWQKRSRKSSFFDTWRRVAGELGGEIELDKRGNPGRLLVPHGNWLVVTDIHTQSNGQNTTTYTRVRVLFNRKEPFTLRVTKRYPFHALGALVGYRAASMGYAQLDRALFVRSDRTDLARAMLRGTTLGQSLMRDPTKLQVTKPGRRIRKIAGDTVGEVQVLKTGKVHEVAELRAIIQICMATVDELARLHIASPDSVEGVKL